MDGKRKYVGKVLLAVIILIQLIYTIYVFSCVKVGSHSDEVWSYGFANSYYQPFHTIDVERSLEAGHDYFINIDEWIPGQVLKNYITVQKGQQFAFGAAYYNNSQDMHPFLFHVLLHAVCSFFPDTFSWWYGFALCLLCLIGTQIYLYLATRKITGSEMAALEACLLYGGGKGALCTFTFIRPYSLLVLLCMAFTYYSACCYEKLDKEGVLPRKYVIPAAVSAGLSFFTHYYGIVYVGGFTAIFCVWMLCKKKVRAMLTFGLSMAAALASLFILYPAALGHILNRAFEVQSFSPAVQIRIILCYLFEYNYGFKIGWFPTAFWNITLPLLGAGIVAIIALLLPFRDEKWFWELLGWLKRQCIAFAHYLKRANYIPFMALGSCVALYEVIAHGVDSYIKGAYSMCYTCLTIPVIAMVVVIALHTIFSGLTKRKTAAPVISCLVICVVLVRVHMSTDYPYNHVMYGEQIDLTEATKGKNVLVIDADRNAFVTEMTYMTADLYDANAICYTSSGALEECMERDDFASYPIDYLIVDMRAFMLSEADVEQLQSRLPEGVRLQVESGAEEGEETADAAEQPQSEQPQPEPLQTEQPQTVQINQTERIRTILGDTPYEVLAIWQGQLANYYILKLTK